MPVPKASANLDDLATTRKDHIGTSRQILGMQTIAIAQAMHQPSNQHLRLGVFAGDGRHIAAADIVYIVEDRLGHAVNQSRRRKAHNLLRACSRRSGTAWWIKGVCPSFARPNRCDHSMTLTLHAVFVAAGPRQQQGCGIDCLVARSAPGSQPDRCWAAVSVPGFGRGRPCFCQLAPLARSAVSIAALIRAIVAGS